MKTYTLKNPRALGEKDEKYGTTWVSYTHDQPEYVMFNLMEGSVGDGSVIEAETVELKKDKNSKDYHRLRKITISSQSQLTPAKATNEELILKKLDEILDRLPNVEVVEQQAPIQDVVNYDIGDEPISLDGIPF